MILAIDVGNTHTVLGVYKSEELLFTFRIVTKSGKTEDEIFSMILPILQSKGFDPKDFTKVIIASVVPTVDFSYSELSAKYFNLEAEFVSYRSLPDIELDIENPKECGADRIVNSYACKIKYQLPALVIDFGTATTFDCISKEGAYFGGVIIPGIGISTNALFSRAAKLPQVKFIKPDKIIGHNTVDMIQSGIVYGFIGQLESIVKEIIKDERMGPETSIILTGGFCKKLAPYVNKDYHIDENLTLFGLNNIALGI